MEPEKKYSGTLAYFKNGIGNWVMLTPALQAIASMEKSGKITIITDSEWTDSRTPALADLWAATSYIENVIRYPKEPYRGTPSRVFYSKHSESSDALQLLSQMNPNFGNQIDWVGSLIHETEYYMELARRLGYTGPTPAQRVPCGNNPMEQGTRYFVVCNGSFGMMRTPKQWPRFREFVKTLKMYYPDRKVVGVGNGRELHDCGELDVNFVGKLSVLDSAAVIRDCDLFITPDTGMMHVGDALGVRMLVLFGGTVVGKSGPLCPRAIVIQSGVACQPCQYTDKFLKCSDAQCMSELSVGKVMSYVRALVQ